MPFVGNILLMRGLPPCRDAPAVRPCLIQYAASSALLKPQIHILCWHDELKYKLRPPLQRSLWSGGGSAERMLAN